MGGMVPTLLASTAPERVLAGICIGPVHPGPAVAEVFRKRVAAVREGMYIYVSTHPSIHLLYPAGGPLTDSPRLT